MADLARGAGAIADQPGTQVNFQVHHVQDRPGYIKSQLAGQAALRQCDEVLISNLNGVVAVVGSDRGPLARDMRRRHQGSSAPVRAMIEQTDRGCIFVGAAMPNPSFIYESAARFEALIALETEEQTLRHSHAQALLRAISEVAQCATHQGVTPIMSLHCPVQLPPRRVGGPRVEERSETWGAPNVIAVRVAFALQKPSSRLRTAMAQRLASYCATRGYGLWLGDLRPGHAQGNWFKVQRPDNERLRDYLKAHHHWSDEESRVERVLPVTLVGPARVGSTNAVLSLLRCSPGLGIAGCAITSLDDLAFIHLQLTSPELKDFDVARDGVDEAQIGVSDRLKLIVEGLGERLQDVDVRDEQPGRLAPRARVIDRAGDYQVLAGPAFELDGSTERGRRPLWFSWRQTGAEAGWRPAIVALQSALNDCGLWAEEATPDRHRCANFEYLLCRAMGGGAFTAKGKLTVPSELLLDRDAPLEYGATKLCIRVKAAWRARLAERGVVGLDSLSFAWREHFLGNSRTR
jgi:putative hemolysin